MFNMKRLSRHINWKLKLRGLLSLFLVSPAPLSLSRERREALNRGYSIFFRLFLFPVLTGIIFVSCHSNPLDVDVSSISVPQVKIVHYEKEFFGIDTTQMTNSLKKLHDKFGDFSDGFISNIICRQERDSLGCDYAIRDFLLDKDMRDVKEECDKIIPADYYPQLENEISDAYKHFQYYFPGRKLPKAVYTDMSGFQNNIVNVNGYYGISLEFYLGENNIFYDALKDLWPAYRRRVSTKEYITSNFVKAW